MVAAVAVGFLLSERVGPPLAQALLGPLLAGGSLDADLQRKWIDLAGAGDRPGDHAAAGRLGGARGALRDAARRPAQLLQPDRRRRLPGLIVLYKLGDAFAGSLMTPFLLKSMLYTQAEVGVVNKVIGLWLTIAGALLGGALMLKLGLWRSLLLFGMLQAASNVGFWWLAVSGKGAIDGLTLPAFDWGFVQLAQPTPVDGGLLLVIAAENLSRRHGNGGLRRLPDEPVQPPLHRHPLCAAVGIRVGRAGLGRAAGRRARPVDRLAGLLRPVDPDGAAGVADADLAAPA